MRNIIVVGSLNMDLVMNVQRLPLSGETLTGNGFMTAPGGKGGNQAVAAAKLGGHVAMIGCVGCDVFGQSLKRSLAGNGVDIAFIREIVDKPTGIAMIIVEGGENRIMLDSGANGALRPEYVDSLDELFTEDSLVVLQLEVPMTTVERAAALAHAKGAKVLLNPAPAVHLSQGLLTTVDILVPNQTECEMITGIDIYTVDDAKTAVKRLNGMGIPQVIVTMGSLGSVYNYGPRIELCEAYRVDAVDTTAAGDSFIGAIAAALCRGKGIEEAVALGSAAGALTVTRKGAQDSLPVLEEVEAFCRRRD